MVEQLLCEGCHLYWTRTVTRGRKPRICDTCRWMGITPVRIPTIKVPSTNRAGSLVINDAGRGTSGIVGETNDCTVRALATATGKPYATAWTFMADNGRRKRKGAPFQSILRRNAHTALGFKFTPYPVQRSRGLASLLRRHPFLASGTWILHSTSHVSTMKDGILYDSFDSTNKIYDQVWFVTPINTNA